MLATGTGRGVRLQNGKKLALVLVVTVGICGLEPAAGAAVPFPTKRLQGSAGEVSRAQGQVAGRRAEPAHPGYEALDPQDPSKYVGFDVDLAQALGQCLGSA